MENRILVDWFACTFKFTHIETLLEYLPFLNDLVFEDLNGWYGYKSRKATLGINLYHEGRSDMGVMLEITGQGCRLLEEKHGLIWYDLFTQIINDNFYNNISRLDLALDIYDRFNLKKLSQDIEKRNYVSRFTNYMITKSNKGLNITIGSPQSLIKFRFYDKAAEQKLNIDWTRFELQLGKERAEQVIKEIIDGLSVGDIYFGVLNNYFRVIQPTASRLENCRTAPYWKKILAHEEKIGIIAMGDPVYQLEDLYNYIYNQAGNSIRAYIDIMGFESFKTDLLNPDMKKEYSDKLKLLINRYS